MEGLVNYIYMIAMCVWAGVSIDAYIEEKKKENSGIIVAWFDLTTAIIAIIIALKVTLT